MSNIGKIIRVNALPPIEEREINVIYQVAEPGAATYTDYAIDETGDLKTHAVTDGTTPIELSDKNVSISNTDLVAEGISTQAKYNTDTREKLKSKLDKPTTNGNVQDFNKVVGIKDNGEVAKIAVDDLSKNVANASLKSIPGAGLILGADWSVDTAGNKFVISGLSDVSANSSFSAFLSQNTAGKLGKTNSKDFFLNIPSALSDSEKTNWKTAMNGGWTTATMSVSIITPPIIDKQDKTSWITLKGANLNLPPSSFSVEIMAQDGITKIATVPNSQVQLYSNGVDLSFYYNFKDFAPGQYKIRLWNGAAYYVTAITLSVMAVLDVINLNSLSWETMLFTPNTPNVVNVSGGAMSYNANGSNKAFARENVIVAALKSSEFAGSGQNFIISGTLKLRDVYHSLMSIAFGVIDTNNTLSLNNNSAFQVSIECNNQPNYSKTIKGDHLTSVQNQNEVNLTAGWTIARHGNIFTVLIEYAGNTSISTKTGIAEALSLVCYVGNTNNTESVGADASFNIQSAYRF